MKLTAAQQEQLKSELSAIWHGDAGMIKHCMTKVKYIIVSGMLVDIGDSKPTIHSDMWYDDETEGPEENKQNFMAYNRQMGSPSHCELSGYNYGDRVELYFIRKYSGQANSNLVAPAYMRGDEPHAIRKVTPEELETINTGIDDIIDDYDKRLERYWKRYSDKVSARGYWANR